MAYGTLAIDTLNTSTGVLASQNGITGIAKAWVYYNASTQTITNSFNVSSVTYSSTGHYVVNYTTAFANANYVVVTAYGDFSSGVGSLIVGTQTTTSTAIVGGIYGSFNDSAKNMVAVFSS
jgi:hypothetical protein